MKKILVLYLFLITILLSSCNSCQVQSLTGKSGSDIYSKLSKDQIEDLTNYIVENNPSIFTLENSNEITKGLVLDILNTKELTSPVDTTYAKSIIKAANRSIYQVKSVYFSWAEIKQAIIGSKYDANYNNNLNDLGISIFFAKNNQNKETLVLHPTLNDSQGHMKLLYTPVISSHALNVGEPCPTRCPKESPYYDDLGEN